MGLIVLPILWLSQLLEYGKTGCIRNRFHPSVCGKDAQIVLWLLFFLCVAAPFFYLLKTHFAYKQAEKKLGKKMGMNRSD
jgi:hypothetical protein